MLNEKKEKIPSKDGKQVNDLLMKPFSLGWTREVVKRVITKNKTPNCDIYYFSPTGKKIRSMIEVKSNLTDGLSPECFSFKKESLGLASNFETVRDARVRKKGEEKLNRKGKSLRGMKKATKRENSESEPGDNVKESKKRKTESEEEDFVKSKPATPEKPEAEEIDLKEEKVNAKSSKEEEQENKNVEEESENKQRKAKQEKKEPQESNNINIKKKTKTKIEKLTKRASSVRSQSVKRRKEVLKKMRSAKQAKQVKVTPGKKILKKIIRKKATRPAKAKPSKSKNENESLRRKGKSKLISKKSTKKQLKTKTEVAKEKESREPEKKFAPTDLKSIVKNNIGKYREMREKQKMGVMKTQMRNSARNIVLGGISRTRSEPISKNKLFYLKPLENGWRRELVFRMNCARAGQQADVYYFHPNGKKLRSCREIAENLTHGLSIECFTFRKEPIGCGEPSEVIRNARSNQRN